MGFDKFVCVWPCFWGCNALHEPLHRDRIQIFYLSNPEEPSALGWNKISSMRFLAKAFQPLLPLPLAKESFIVIVQTRREVEWIHCALCTTREWREEVKRDWMEKLWTIFTWLQDCFHVEATSMICIRNILQRRSDLRCPCMDTCST